LKNNTIDLANFVNDKVYFPMRERIVFIFDEATKVLSFLVQIYNEHQEEVSQYINTHYENVKVELQKNWIKLDFDQDGIVSVSDFKESLTQLYQFLLSFNYLHEAQTIKSSVYSKAVNYLKTKEQNSESVALSALEKENLSERISQIDQQIERAQTEQAIEAELEQ